MVIGRVSSLAGWQMQMRTHNVALAWGVLQVVGGLGHSPIATDTDDGHTRSASGWVEACWLICWCFCSTRMIECLWARMIRLGNAKMTLKFFGARSRFSTLVSHFQQSKLLVLVFELNLVPRVYLHLRHFSLWGESLRVRRLRRLLLFNPNDSQVFEHLRQVQPVSFLTEFKSVLSVIERLDVQNIEQLLEPRDPMHIVVASSRPRVLSPNKPTVESRTGFRFPFIHSLFNWSILSETLDIICGRLIITFGFTCTLHTWVLCPCDPIFEPELERMATCLLFEII